VVAVEDHIHILNLLRRGLLGDAADDARQTIRGDE
jgi:hypothetical protein